MSITTALYSSFYGLRNTEQRIGVTAQNVTNADQPGYTRKELQNDLNTTNAGTVPVNSQIVTVDYNEFLLEGLIEDGSAADMQAIIAEYMGRYTSELGSIDGNNSISAFLDDFASALDQLSQTPEDFSLKNQVVFAAELVADELNRLTTAIQDARLQADQEIERAVNQVNEITALIQSLNEEILAREAVGLSSADLVDQRNIQLEELSQYIEFDYFTTSTNVVNIYTAGRPLLDSRARVIDYEANTALDKTTIYPAGFNSIDLDGVDMTTLFSGGEIAGLISTRDGFMVEEQAKLDAFAASLIEQMNTLLNQGASVPPRDTIEGELDALAAGTVFAGTGVVRIATTDETGTVQNFADINIAGFGTIGALIGGINAALGPDITASLTGTGQLSLVANNAGEGISMNEMTSDIGGEGFSMFFGLNNLFDGTDAADIEVSEYLTTAGQFLATSRLDNNALLAIGDVGVNIGDSTLTAEMNDAVSASYNFAAAGNFSAQTETLDNYIDNIIADAAYRTQNAETDSAISQSLKDQAQTTLNNLSGVNIDEEMTLLIDLEAKYEAAATMIAKLQEMFDTLLAAVR